MTEFEFIEAASMNLEFIRSAAMDFITVFFAYVVTAHLAGKSMQTTVAVALPFLYTLFLLGPFSGIIGTTIAHVNLVNEAIRQYADSVVFVAEPNEVLYLITAFVPSSIGWLFSLVYMHKFVRG